LHPGAQLFHEALRHAFLHEQARARAADLALVEPDRVHDALDHAVEIRVVVDDEWTLTAKLQTQLLAGARRRATDDASDFGGSGEGDLVDVIVLHERLSGLAVPGDDVEHSSRQPDALGHLREKERRHWREFRGLEHHGASGSERGSHLPRQHEKRKVPRNDLTHDTDALVALELRVEELCPAGVMVEVSSDERNVDVARLANRFAV